MHRAKEASELRGAILIGILLVAAACSKSSSSEAAPVARNGDASSTIARVETAPPPLENPRVVFPNGKIVDVEIAADDVTRAQGLMFRENLEDGEGMLFLFPEPGIYPFWMKNTLIFLDLLWLDQRGRIVHLEAMAEPCRGDPCPNYVPGEEALYVLELAGGEAERNGLSEGQTLELRNLQSVDIR